MFCAGVGSAGGASETSLRSYPDHWNPRSIRVSGTGPTTPSSTRFRSQPTTISSIETGSRENDPRPGSDQYDTDDCENAARAEDPESEAASISTGEECSSEECDPHTDHSSISGNSHREREHRPEGNRYEAHA